MGNKLISIDNINKDMVRTNHNASNPQTVVNGCDMINVWIWLPLFNISDNANNAFRYVDNENVMTTNKALSIACDVCTSWVNQKANDQFITYYSQ